MTGPDDFEKVIIIGGNYWSFIWHRIQQNYKITEWFQNKVCLALYTLWGDSSETYDLFHKVNKSVLAMVQLAFTMKACAIKSIVNYGM